MVPMNSERWQQCKQIFQAALDLPRPDRAAYVRQACGEDEELRREIVSLLESAEHSDQFLSEAAANYVAGALPGLTALGSRLPAGEVLAGRYRILRLIGRGGMGEVYEAEDLELRAPVALKLVLPEIAVQQDILDRFRREVLLARQVTHPNVCRIFDLGYHTGGPAGRMTFLTMELLAGETLSDRLARTGPMKTAEALPLVQQLVAGLAAAHRAGIVHRDFKSGNVILAPDDEGGHIGAAVHVKIMDFGLARAVTGGDLARTTLTVAGGLVGTPAYMAPEQIEGGEITPATDIYALGVVMYEMVTGALPFSGDSPWIVATKRLREAAPSPRTHVPGLERTWETVILRCLERSPAARYSSATDVGKALRGDPVAPPAAPPAQERKRPRRHVHAAVLAMSVLGSAIGYYLIAKSTRKSVQSSAGQYGWHQVALPPDPSLAQVTAAAGSIDPLQVILFSPSFTRAWIPGQSLASPMPMPFPAISQAECAAGLWMIQDDNRHIAKWDPAKQQPIVTIALPWPFKSAACLDESASRWGFLVDQGASSRWIEFDVRANRMLRTVALDASYVTATLDPPRQSLALIGSSSVSVRSLDRLRETFGDTLSEKLLGRPAAGWSESGRYFALGFKQLAIFDLTAKRHVRTLTTTGWISGIGWIGDEGVSAMDDRGRLYWTSDISKDWQLRQEPPAQSVYQPFWIASHYRWLALGKQGQALVWEYVTPRLLFDLQVSPLDVWTVAASPESDKAAVAGKDPRIFVIDLHLKKQVQILEGHTDGIPFVQFDGPDRLVSASDDKTIRIWDTAGGKLLKTAAGHESLVNAFAISPDGKWLVSVSSDSKIKLWRLPELAFVKDIGATIGGGAAAAFLPDGEHLLISDWKGNLSLYQGRPPDWSMRQQFQLGKKVVYMVCPSRDAWWAVVSEGDAAGLWRLPASDLGKGSRVSQDPPSYCATAGDGRFTAVQFPNRVEVRSNADGQLTAAYRFAARDGAAVAIGYHRPTVMVGFSDGHLLGWPLAP